MNTGPTKKFQLIQKPARNRKKPHVFDEKSAETAPVFVQNKPKVKSPQICLSDVITSTYAQIDNWLNAKNKPKQTQFKANSNPTPRMLINTAITALYTQKPPSGGHKNKPKTNPTPKMNTNPYKTKTYIEKPPAGPIKTNPNKPNQRRAVRITSRMVNELKLFVLLNWTNLGIIIKELTITMFHRRYESQ
jgi:hypothetical protein